ncbi:hypothetical protein GGI12_005746 [Dipsacomyces acuminosporus]|nr:hypothetical protein GGI12_005746 [Dipsacomyces acuminosporus]
MKLSLGFLAMLAASPALISGADTAQKNASVRICNSCYKPSNSSSIWYYDITVHVKDCYVGGAGGRKESPKGRCSKGDFSLPMYQDKDTLASWSNKKQTLSVRYGKKWRRYNIRKADKKYKIGERDCVEWFDKYEPAVCKGWPTATPAPAAPKSL